MFAITNATRHAATAVILTDPDGRDVVLAVAKATYVLPERGRPELAAEPLPLVYADAYRDEAGESSLVAVSDFALRKPGADVIVFGSATAPGGREVASMTVSVRVGAVEAELLVTGDRIWKKGLFGLAMSSPKPFREMPLLWERAFGGQSPPKDGDGVVRWAANPVGRGFWLTERSAVDMPLPNLEWPDDRVQKLTDRPAPAGCGFVSPDWESRAVLAGTYDAGWERERMPLLPEDFDPHFFQCAPVRLQSKRCFVGREPVRLLGLHEAGERSFALPEDRIDIDLLTPGDVLETHSAQLDTVVIDTEQKLVQLVWRACVPAPAPLTRLQHVRIRSAHHPAPVASAEAIVGAGGGSHG